MAEQTVSINYDLVKNFYDTEIDGIKLWDINKVFDSVNIWITEEEYGKITSFIYPSKS